MDNSILNGHKMVYSENDTQSFTNERKDARNLVLALFNVTGWKATASHTCWQELLSSLESRKFLAWTSVK